MSADFLLELLSEEIPARMQRQARADLARLFAQALGAAGIAASEIVTYSTPRRLALIARGLALETEAVREELKGPRSSAPPQALAGFLRKTGLARDHLVERGGVLFASIDKPGRPTAEVLGEAVAAIVGDFPWPKSMRWGAASADSGSLRWVRPLHSIVALLGEEIVAVAVEGVASSAATLGHRFHHPGPITIGGAHDYVEKLRACHVVVDQAEREQLIRDGARAAAAGAGLTLVEDEGLVAENAGLTEWPAALLGRFDAEFLDVPREVIVLTMRTNQKYFALTDSEGALAPAFVCTANIAASDGGASIVEGNRRVLAARLADARFFWQQDLQVPLDEQANKLGGIVFHEKLGSVADKVERVAKLARWLVEEGVVPAISLSPAGRGQGEGAQASSGNAPTPHPNPLPAGEREKLADMAERAARLAKADLVTGMVGEFPELQGVIGGHLARAQGEPPEIADAIRDHYKPVPSKVEGPAGQGDEVPTVPVTVAVSLADKLDTLASFMSAGERSSGSRDPFALRRAALGIIELILVNRLRLRIRDVFLMASGNAYFRTQVSPFERVFPLLRQLADLRVEIAWNDFFQPAISASTFLSNANAEEFSKAAVRDTNEVIDFFADRLKVQQREAGVRHDLIDAVFALGGEDDLVRLLARVKALQAFVETGEGADLLAGYKRAANILKKEGYAPSPPGGEGGDEGARSSEATPDRQTPSPNPLPEGEGLLVAALDAAEPKAREALAAEDFTGAMAALASLRAPIDCFFDQVTVNDPDAAVRARRLNLLARFRDAVHQVADFSKIEG